MVHTEDLERKALPKLTRYEVSVGSVWVSNDGAIQPFKVTAVEEHRVHVEALDGKRPRAIKRDAFNNGKKGYTRRTDLEGQ